MPRIWEEKLSDLYEIPSDALELKVKVYNINYSEHSDLLERCKTLQGYSFLVQTVREQLKLGLSREQAFRYAMDYCRSHDIIAEFLEKHAGEGFDMISAEWNLEDAKRVWQEEAEARGRALGEICGEARGEVRGEQNAMRKFVLRLLHKGNSYDHIADLSGIEISKVEQIAREEGIFA